MFDETATKRCKKCGEVKPLSDYYAMKGMRDGHRNECKTCNLKEHDRYVADPEKVKARVRRWQEANRERYLAKQRRNKQTPEGKARDRAGHLRRKYGITQAEYEALLARQGGGCAICEYKPPDGAHLHIDHDHRTGKPRGLLCFKCNNALGDFDDDRELLLRAVEYLADHDSTRELVMARLVS